MPICVLHGEEVLHQLMPWQELFVIETGAVDLRASFRRAAIGQMHSFSHIVSSGSEIVRNLCPPKAPAQKCRYELGSQAIVSWYNCLVYRLRR